MSGTMKMKHPKRGGWKGAKKSRRNFDSAVAFKEHQKKDRKKQVWVVSPVGIREEWLEPGNFCNEKGVRNLMPLRTKVPA